MFFMTITAPQGYAFRSCAVNDLTPSCLANNHSIEQTTSCGFLKEHAKEKSGSKVFDSDDTMRV